MNATTMRRLVRRAIARLRETSSWAGLAIVGAAAGFQLDEGALKAVALRRRARGRAGHRRIRARRRQGRARRAVTYFAPPPSPAKTSSVSRSIASHAASINCVTWPGSGRSNQAISHNTISSEA